MLVKGTCLNCGVVEKIVSVSQSQEEIDNDLIPFARCNDCGALLGARENFDEEIDKLRAENERLREALELIEASGCESAEPLRNKARAVLAGEGRDETLHDPL